MKLIYSNDKIKHTLLSPVAVGTDINLNSSLQESHHPGGAVLDPKGHIHPIRPIHLKSQRVTLHCKVLYGHCSVRTSSFTDDKYAPASFLKCTPLKQRITGRIALWRT